MTNQWLMWLILGHGTSHSAKKTQADIEIIFKTSDNMWTEACTQLLLGEPGLLLEFEKFRGIAGKIYGDERKALIECPLIALCPMVKCKGSRLHSYTFIKV